MIMSRGSQNSTTIRFDRFRAWWSPPVASKRLAGALS